MAGLVLMVVPVLALVVTHRVPGPVFLGQWWSPIASVPADTLTIGTLGLTLLLATALALALTVPLRRARWYPLVGSGLVVAIVLACGVGWSVAAASSAATSGAAIRAVLLDRAPTADVSGQARRAFELAVGWPTPTPSGVHVLRHSSVPAGPWLVQSTEILNEHLSDEGSDVEVETLLDPITGSIVAAWYYGL